MEAIGFKDKNKTVYDLAMELDSNKNGAIDFHEFLNMMPGQDTTYAYKTGYK